MTVFEAFKRGGLVKSSREFRQFVKDGAIRVQEILITDHNAKLQQDEGFVFLVNNGSETPQLLCKINELE